MNQESQTSTNPFDVSPTVPRAYFNGFTISVGPADTTITLTQNNIPVIVLHCSHTIAKTLAQTTGDTIQDWEHKIEQKIPLLEELKALLMKNNK